jgi:hypothetical protein
MPKPLVKFAKEKISREFFCQRIDEITKLIQRRREIRLLLTFCVWLQANRPETLKELKKSAQHLDRNSQQVSINDLKYYLDLVDEKINFQNLPNDILKFYNHYSNQIKDGQSAEYIQINKKMAKLILQIVLYLNSPIDPPWDFIEEIFVIPRPFTSLYRHSDYNNGFWYSERFDFLTKGAQDVIKLIYSMFEYFSLSFSGIQEHFLLMSASLFWCTRPESVYSLEIYELLGEMFGAHKLYTRSTQLYENSSNNDLIKCEKKGRNKNRSIIYFGLRPGAEWIITGFFPDQRLIMQQQAVAISFLRYSKQILTCPWTINPMNFNYLMDIWFRSFLYSDNLDQIVFEKARQLKRNIDFKQLKK